MQKKDPFQHNLAGYLLVAHPSLQDPNFVKTIVLMATYEEDEGSIGVVINRPLNETLGSKAAHFAHTPLASVPLFEGGPIGIDKIILAAWQWLSPHNVFKFHFGITEEQAYNLLDSDEDIYIRGFVGHAGWTTSQLAEEIHQKTWLVTSINAKVMKNSARFDIWLSLLAFINPELMILAEEPEDPSLN